MGKLYQTLVRPLAFRFDEERMHRLALKSGEIAGRYQLLRDLVHALYYHADHRLSVTLAGVTYPSVAGLAAGYDKYCQWVRIAPHLSMGHIEIGTFTPPERDGNKPQRLFRLPQDFGLINRMGLNNYGLVKTVDKIREEAEYNYRTREDYEFEIPVDINLDPNTFFAEDREEDEPTRGRMVFARELLWGLPYAKTINISCPNTQDGKAYENPAGLDLVLQRSDIINKQMRRRNTRVKFSPDLDRGMLAECLDVCMRHMVDGTVHSNTTNIRDHLVTPMEELESVGRPGGYSGLRNFERNLGIVEFVRNRVGDRMYRVGVGGIGCNPETTPAFDTYCYLQHGADIVQVLTGVPYYGFDIFKQISLELPHILEHAGFSSLEDFRRRRG